MRIVISTKSIKPVLWWLQVFLFGTAGAIFLYSALVLGDRWRFQKVERDNLDFLLTEQRTVARAAGVPSFSGSFEPLPIVAAGGVLGSIAIPRLGLSSIILEGTSTATLQRAAGHIRGTALPGQRGNVGISAHRDTFFRPLRNIRQNDTITLTTLGGEYRYRVVSTKVVSPSDVGVLKAGDTQSLTLVTCYPFYFIGPAPERFIVRAQRED